MRSSSYLDKALLLLLVMGFWTTPIVLLAVLALGLSIQSLGIETGW